MGRSTLSFFVSQRAFLGYIKEPQVTKPHFYFDSKQNPTHFSLQLLLLQLPVQQQSLLN